MRNRLEKSAWSDVAECWIPKLIFIFKNILNYQLSIVLFLTDARRIWFIPRNTASCGARITRNNFQPICSVTTISRSPSVTVSSWHFRTCKFVTKKMWTNAASTCWHFTKELASREMKLTRMWNIVQFFTTSYFSIFFIPQNIALQLKKSLLNYVKNIFYFVKNVSGRHDSNCYIRNYKFLEISIFYVGNRLECKYKKNDYFIVKVRTF